MKEEGWKGKSEDEAPVDQTISAHSQALLHKLCFLAIGWCHQIKQKKGLIQKYWVAHRICGKTGRNNLEAKLPRKSHQIMQHSWPSEETEAISPSPLSNFMLPGGQFDCNQRYYCHFCTRNSTWWTTPVPQNHKALPPLSPARRSALCRFFPLIAPFFTRMALRCIRLEECKSYVSALAAKVCVCMCVSILPSNLGLRMGKFS